MFNLTEMDLADLTVSLEQFCALLSTLIFVVVVWILFCKCWLSSKDTQREEQRRNRS